ncbi:hypothetical protein I5M32_02190 [Pedobacter sp. SD-b]|uniref:Uncharacterized protein n=1 Tax=Pedobacter segetis TaxID=2793069 RepID=A0ABS1BFX3_9SPHI|nr:hypothetical protein [Pedobacter segetis]MBK0381758.1 hypothetical protein [Pedobacter segetis]
MKKFNLTLATLILIVVFSSCKKDKKPNNNKAQNAKEFSATFGSQKQSFSLNTSELPKTITMANGSKITFKPGCFTVNGSPASGAVTVESYEMLNRSSIIFSGTNTNHISGQPLISQGFINIKVKVNGVAVDDDLAIPMTVSIPAKGKDFTQIWAGVEKVGDVNQMAWQAPKVGPNGQNQRETKAVNDNFVFDFGQLGWINCDTYYRFTDPKTTVGVTVLNNPGEMASFRGFTGDTYVYFCANGDNVVAQLYSPNGPNSVKSYDNSMPIGATGTLFSLSIKDGKYYFAKKMITITANLNETLSLTESTEAAVQAEINALN